MTCFAFINKFVTFKNIYNIKILNWSFMYIWEMKNVEKIG